MRGVGKFWFPAICIIISIVLLVKGFFGDPSMRQSDLALYGTIAILIFGIVSLFFLLDLVKKPVVWVLSIFFLLGAAFFGYSNFQTINEELVLTKKKNLIKAKMIQRLKDVRTAEIAFQETNGVFTKNWVSLKSFVRSGKIATVKNIGAIPDTLTASQCEELGLFVSRPAGMSDAQIIKAGLIVRDTIYENALQVLFENEKSMSKRKFPLDLDHFDIAPGTTDTQLKLEAGQIEVSGGVKRNVFACYDPEPFSGTPLKVGSMTEAMTNGNWKE